MKVPMLDLRREYEYMKDGIDGAIRACLEHQHWILGPEVGEFEDKAADYLGAAHCVGVSSGTDALVLALRAIAIKKMGREHFERSEAVITTPFTFTATGDAIIRAGATPLFVDIDPETFNIDPDKIEACLSEIEGRADLKVVGLLPVHLYGRACPMDRIMAIAAERGLFVVEDVAQAFGASWAGRRLGTIGDAGAFSFFPSKNLGGFGDSGLVATGDPEIEKIVRMLVKHGGADKYNADHLGYNARMDTLQAAILLVRLRYIEGLTERRRLLASFYSSGLSATEGLVVPAASDDGSHVFHQYTIRIGGGRRDGVQGGLKNKGIDTAVYYPQPLHKMGLFSGSVEIFSLHESERAAREVLSLPVEPLLEEEEARAVVEAVESCMAVRSREDQVKDSSHRSEP